MNTNNNNTGEFSEEKTFIFEYDHNNFLEIYQIAENNYIDYEVNEEYDIEIAHIINKIKKIASIASSNKLENEDYMIPQETQGKLIACYIMNYKNESFQ
ncbi:6437_t:CDS:1, partial [Diversispora eburnea]